MKGFIVLLASVALAAGSPTLGLLSHVLGGGHGLVGGGGHGIGGHGVAIPGGGVPGLGGHGLPIPGGKVPRLGGHGVAIPGGGVPGLGDHGVAIPGGGVPGLGDHGVAIPGGGVPGLGGHGVAIPGGGVPGLGGHGVAIPGGGVPGLGGHGVAIPGGGVPGLGDHGVAIPGGGVPGIGGGILGGVRPGGRTDRGYHQKGGVYPIGGGGLFQVLGFLGQGLTDKVGNAGSILDDVVHLRIPAILDDGFNAVMSVGRALGGIVNAIIPGLGTLLGNLVVSIAKILLCLLGSPGLTGSILGDRRPGRDNPRDIPYICSPDYGREWGCAYDGPYDNPTTIIKHYKINNARQQAQEFIDKTTNRQGMNSLTGSRRIIATRILIIATIMDKGPKNWTDGDIVNLVISIISINAVIGESYQHGLGKKVINEWINALKKNNKNEKFPDVSKYRQQMMDDVNGLTEDKWEGAFDQNKRGEWNKIKNSSDSDDNDSQNNSRDTDNNTRNDSDNTNDNKNTKNTNKKTSKNKENDNTTENENTKNTNKNTNRNTENDTTNDNDNTKNKNKNTNRDDQSDDGGSGKGSGHHSGSDSSDSSSNNDGNSSLKQRDTSSKGSQYTDENSRSRKNSGSGRNIKNADGSSEADYNYSNSDDQNSRKTYSDHDDRMHGLEYTQNAD